MVIRMGVEFMNPLVDDGDIFFRFVISFNFLCFSFKIFLGE